MCPSSHVLPPLLGELTDSHACANVHENRRAYACWPMCVIFLCLCVQHAHTDEFTGGQAGDLAWTEMNTCWDQSSSVWFTFLSLFLSFFQSLAFFCLLTPHSHLCLLCLVPWIFEDLAVEDLFSPKNSPEEITYLFCSLFVSFKGSMVLGLSPTSSFLLLSFF